MADWYCKITEQIVGPMSADHLKALADGGRLAPNDLIARTKEGPWVPASRVKGLFEVAAIQGESAAHAPQVVPQPAPALPQTPAQAATKELPAPPAEQPPIPQPPVVMPKRAAAPSSPPLPTVESPPAVVAPPAELGPFGGFAIQTEKGPATQRFQRKKRVKKPKEPLTKKQKNARLVRWLAIATVAGFVVFASIPFLRKSTQSAPEAAPAKKPVGTDVDLTTTANSLEDTFGTASQTGSRRATSPTSSAVRGSASGLQPRLTEEAAASSVSAGAVEVVTEEALEKPLEEPVAEAPTSDNVGEGDERIPIPGLQR